MTLPFDIARCAGISFPDATVPGGIDWREGCEDCRRREPGHPERQAHMSPPEIITFECAYRIGGLAEGVSK